MIDTMLISIAIGTGAVQFEDRGTDYRMFASVLGMKVTLATITKKQLAMALAQTADGSIVPAQPVETRPPAETPAVSPPVAAEAPARKRPAFQVITGGAA